MPAELLLQADVHGFWAFASGTGFILNLLALLKRTVAFLIDVAVVKEDVFATVFRSDEAEAFLVVKPFYCAVIQFLLPIVVRAG